MLVKLHLDIGYEDFHEFIIMLQHFYDMNSRAMEWWVDTRGHLHSYIPISARWHALKVVLPIDIENPYDYQTVCIDNIDIYRVLGN